MERKEKFEPTPWLNDNERLADPHLEKPDWKDTTLPEDNTAAQVHQPEPKREEAPPSPNKETIVDVKNLLQQRDPSLLQEGIDNLFTANEPK